MLNVKCKVTRRRDGQVLIVGFEWGIDEVSGSPGGEEKSRVS